MSILGIDEVGRGPLAGPLVVGAVILPPPGPDGQRPAWINELEDSKKLSPKKRAVLSALIWKHATACSLGWVKIEELNKLGLSDGLRVASERAIKDIQNQHAHFTQIALDGNINFLTGTPFEPLVTTVVKGDALIKEISAASIIAKVARDEYMIKLGAKYPEYGFEKHMGYGTSQHLMALAKYGALPEHRLFCEPVAEVVGIPRRKFASHTKNTTAIGTKGEEATCNYLRAHGHTIITQNYKTRSCEIDVISTLGNRIFFTEVKTRKDGNGIMAIGTKKLNQMRYAAEVFLKMEPSFSAYQPILAAASVGKDYKVLDWFTID